TTWSGRAGAPGAQPGVACQATTAAIANGIGRPSLRAYNDIANSNQGADPCCKQRSKFRTRNKIRKDEFRAKRKKSECEKRMKCLNGPETIRTSDLVLIRDAL